MGESKIPKTPPAPMKRPGAAILAMKAAVQAFKGMSSAATIDPYEVDYMRDLSKIVAWIEELEASTEPFAKIVPLIDPMATDLDQIILIGPILAEDARDPPPTLTAGQFRRLNPMAANSPPKLDA